MAVCPKCSYGLVLLEHRSKYKCALCSRLYPQKEIDDKEFRGWNQRQRILDTEVYNQKREEELTQISELKTQLKYLFNGLPKSDKEYQKEYFQRNNSESGFGEDKQRFGWKLSQRREDRIDTAIFCNTIWHNLFWLHNS